MQTIIFEVLGSGSSQKGQRPLKSTKEFHATPRSMANGHLYLVQFLQEVKDADCSGCLTVCHLLVTMVKWSLGSRDRHDWLKEKLSLLRFVDFLSES